MDGEKSEERGVAGDLLGGSLLSDNDDRRTMKTDADSRATITTCTPSTQTVPFRVVAAPLHGPWLLRMFRFVKNE